MKKMLASLFVCTVTFVVALGLFTSVAQAEPVWCSYYCTGCYPLDLQCTCPGNPYRITTCYGWCTGACEDP